MQLGLLLALVLAFSCLLNADGRPVMASDVKLLGCLLAGSSLVGVAWWFAHIQKLAETGRMSVLSFSNGWVERFYSLVYLLMTFVIFVVLDFAEIVHTNWGLHRFVLADDLAVSMMVVVPALICWSLAMAPVVMERRAGSRGEQLSQLVLLVRQLIVLPLLPILMITGITDLHRLMLPGSSDGVRVVLGLGSVMAIALTLPCLLRCCWPTRPLEVGEARTLMETTLRKAGVSVTQILRWETNGQLANAAIAGFLPRLRYLFVTDALLQRLGPAELRAITAHEAAHCRLGHFPRLAVSLAIPFLALLLGDQLTVDATWLGPARTPSLMLLVLGLWAGWHGWWARLLEHQADIVACRLMSASCRAEGTAVESFRRALAATGARPEGDWLHPAPLDRVRLLSDLAGDPIAQAGFDRRIRLVYHVQWLVIAALAAACLAGA